MDTRFVNPFITAAVQMLKETADLELTKGTPEIGEGRSIFSGYGVVIGVTGSVKGQILYEMPYDFSIAVTEKLNGKKKDEFSSEDEFDDMIQSTINELGNMISGRAITTLSKENINCVITPPTLFKGEGIEVIAKNLETIIVPFDSKFGSLKIAIAIEV